MVFGLFSKERALKRAKKKATNKLTQQQERWPAMQKLADAGDYDSLYTLFRRFSFQSTKQVEDLEEKDWAVATLISKGQDVLEPLRAYLLDADAVSYPLRILEGVATPEQAKEIVDELLAQEEPGYTRDASKKCDILNWLGEYEELSNDEVVERVLPYLEDFDENVRFAAISSIGLRPSETSAEPLVNRLLDPDEESRRVKLLIAEVLAEHKMPLAGRHKEVADLFGDLLPEYKLHRNKLMRKD